MAYWVMMKQREKLSGTLSLLLWREKNSHRRAVLWNPITYFLISQRADLGNNFKIIPRCWRLSQKEKKRTLFSGVVFENVFGIYRI